MNDDEFRAKLKAEMLAACAAIPGSEHAHFNRSAFVVGWLMGRCALTHDEYVALANELSGRHTLAKQGGAQ